MGLFNALFNNKESLTLSNKWEFFITTVDDRVTGIRVDIGAIQDERFDRLNHTWFFRVRYTHCYENGLPQPDETQRLNRIEDWLEERGKTLPIWLVGVVTQEGWRDFVFQSEKELDWERMLDKLLAGGPEVSCSYSMSKNDNGNYYHQFLYPSKYDWNWIHDSRVCRGLLEHGDDLTLPRTIDYYATLPTEDAARAFAEDVAILPYGITLVNIRMDEGYMASFTNTDAPEQLHMTDITCQLTDLAEKHGGSFDGWGAPIATA
ncbi:MULTISPECIES: DUF695 domain-containing protein [unclassified Escherichia]|uniref:DUF695 domain-containing protein n=1 Tax=unclassified Escherichia TaxID=2608889 RepID=UPI001029414B|nr:MULTISPECIES: DUF695 domain-containing protein [unclassified Escherichia]RZM88350.1 DUF695 domain-containing protein [Escherichia sp. E1V33]TBR65275.1 DUF695 domain-containing protein [Escherichia sp. E1S7]